MKKMIFGIALILFGFSMAYISAQAQWAITQPVSLLAVFAGLLFAVWGVHRKRMNLLFDGKGGYSDEKACRLDFNTRFCMGAHWLLQSQHELHH